MSPYPAVAIMGATATGKSRVAIKLARSFGGEIISMDSRQVYRGLDVGTAKVGHEERAQVPHHMIDVLDPGETNSAGRHVAGAREAAKGITGRGRLPFFVGGTGLYFRVLFDGLIDVEIPPGELEAIRRRLSALSTEDLYAKLLCGDPERAGELSANDRLRVLRALEILEYTGEPASQHMKKQEPSPPWSGLKVVLTMPRVELRRRIARRTREMYEAGWVAEVRGLLDSGVPIGAPAMRSLGYGVVGNAIREGAEPAGTVEQVITQTQQYAKRQETFFRSVAGAHWVDSSKTPPQEEISRLLEQGRL